MIGRHTTPGQRRRSRRAAGLAVVVATSSLVGVATVAFAPSSNAYDPARNILTNWQFSSPAVASGSLNVSAGSSAITGWSVTSGNVDVVAASGVRGVINATPSQAIDLNGTGPGAIAQTFATTPGYTYTGDYFFFSATAVTTPVVKTATLTLNSTTTAISYDSSNANGWLQEQFSFKATGPTSTITFASTTPGADGPLISLVEVYPPYPLYLDPVQNLVVYQQIPAGADVAYYASAENLNEGRGRAYTDVCDHPSGSVFPVGTTTVNCTLTEPEGPSSSESFTITVIGTTSSCSALPFGSPTYVAAHPASGANVVGTPCTTAVYRPGKPTVITLLPGVSNLDYSFGPTSIEFDGTLAYSEYDRSTQSSMTSVANTSLGSVTISVFGNTYTVTNLTSQAEASLGYRQYPNADCSTATASGSTSVGSLAYNGKTSSIDKTPTVLDLGLGLVKIYLNQQIKVGNTITERAMFIDLPGTANDIAIAQSVAGESCTS